MVHGVKTGAGDNSSVKHNMTRKRQIMRQGNVSAEINDLPKCKCDELGHPLGILTCVSYPISLLCDFRLTVVNSAPYLLLYIAEGRCTLLQS